MYDFARALKGRFTDGDFNLTLLYNSSTYYDDLAWAAGWLYKATKQVGARAGRAECGLVGGLRGVLSCASAGQRHTHIAGADPLLPVA